MYKVDKIDLKEDIRIIKNANLEELLFLFNYAIKTYLYAGITFGFSSDIATDCLNIVAEFRKIITKEKYLLKKIYKNSHKIDLEELDKYLEDLDEANEKSYMYYTSLLDSIYDACVLKQEHRGKRYKKNFSAITDDYRYDMSLLEISVDINDIKNYFGYEDNFWKYISKRTTYLDSRKEEDEEFSMYGVFFKTDEENNCVDFRICVPEIINLETALINVHEIKHAHDLYEQSKVKCEDYYEIRAINSENDFKNSYLVKKLQDEAFK